MDITGSPHISIRLATEADHMSLLRLAALDSAAAPRGPVIVADLGGDIVAARSLVRDRSIADPFRPTAYASELLVLRSRQLPPSSHPRRRHLPRFPMRRRAVRSAITA
jgi:hypothetical protein